MSLQIWQKVKCASHFYNIQSDYVMYSALSDLCVWDNRKQGAMQDWLVDWFTCGIDLALLNGMSWFVLYMYFFFQTVMHCLIFPKFKLYMTFNCLMTQ